MNASNIDLTHTLPGAAFVTGAAFVLLVVVWCAVRAYREMLRLRMLEQAAEDEREFDEATDAMIRRGMLALDKQPLDYPWQPAGADWWVR